MSLLASMASLVLALVAIWLSFKFYDSSKESSEKIEEANRSINASIVKLEEIFKMQYSDTFSIVRDSYQRLLQGAESVEDHDPDEKVDELRKEVFSEIKTLIVKADETDARIGTIQKGLERVVDKAIGESRNIEKEGIEKKAEELIRQVLAPIPRGTTVKVSRLVE
ncbi:MAG TPA: hypothetical protein VNZ44_03990, partial [Pyrinomonadaceae bacterium]|nr:hypothetical protein [Pyrinomonadaceae bacterium]